MSTGNSFFPIQALIIGWLCTHTLYDPFKKRNASSQRKKAQCFGKAQNAEEMTEIKAICS